MGKNNEIVNIVATVSLERTTCRIRREIHGCGNILILLQLIFFVASTLITEFVWYSNKCETGRSETVFSEKCGKKTKMEETHSAFWEKHQCKI